MLTKNSAEHEDVENNENFEYAENLENLEKRIEGLKLDKGNIVVAFDFDELVIESNLTDIVAEAVAGKQKNDVAERKKALFKRIADKKLKLQPSKAVRYSVGFVKGFDWTEYKKVMLEKAKEAKWRDGFKDLIQELNKRYNLIFINSGPKEVVYSKLREIDFDPENIIGDEFKVENGKITGADLIVLNRIKGRAVAGLRSRNYKVMGIGHSIEDDFFMLHNSNLSIAYIINQEENELKIKIHNNFRLAQYIVSSVEEISDLIKKNV